MRKKKNPYELYDWEKKMYKQCSLFDQLEISGGGRLWQ